jgi:hypothetical protein
VFADWRIHMSHGIALCDELIAAVADDSVSNQQPVALELKQVTRADSIRFRASYNQHIAWP